MRTHPNFQFGRQKPPILKIAVRWYSALSRPSLDGLRMQSAKNDGRLGAIDETLNGRFCFHSSIKNAP